MTLDGGNRRRKRILLGYISLMYDCMGLSYTYDFDELVKYVLESWQQSVDFLVIILAQALLLMNSKFPFFK